MLEGDCPALLHRLVPGAASRSYGVAVAKLAGLPETVLARAKALLVTLESGGSAPDAPLKRALKPACMRHDDQLSRSSAVVPRKKPAVTRS